MTKQEYLDTTLPFVSRASRYLGNEINAVRKDSAGVDLFFALAFPDVYEVGMSHLGLQILYHVLNSLDGVACERVFAPWPDMEALMRGRGLPLATLESQRPLRACDIVGFSLEYELSYATVLRMLDLAGIPLTRTERPDSFPLVIAGGPSAFNPEPVADFFDAILIGDGEEAVQDICREVCAARQQEASKERLLAALCRIPGVYVPGLFQVRTTPAGGFQTVAPLTPGYTHVKKRVAAGFSAQPFCTAPIVPYMQIIHDRAAVEIARGCSRGCRFCMAGMIYRPVREKKPDDILELADLALAQSGYGELGLASLSSGDYSCIENVLCRLMQAQQDQQVAVSLPSLRVETLTDRLVQEIQRVRRTGFTIAPEAGTPRLRAVINKNFTDEAILATAERVFRSGWNLIKLYFMIGLPTETREDLEGIVALSRKIARIDRRKKITVSVSTFVPKPHTPFQWAAQDPPDIVLEKQRFLRDALKPYRSIRLKWHDHELSTLEGVFSRGDRQLSSVLLRAHELGAGLEAWSDFFRPGLWQQAFEDCGIDPHRYLGPRSVDTPVPWDHIHSGISTEFLLEEREKAAAAVPTPDCRSGHCSKCGVCEQGELAPELIAGPAALLPAGTQQSPGRRTPVDTVRYRLHYRRTGPARFLSHLEFSTCLARAMRRARLPVKHSQGFHPMPRIMFFEALPVGMECLHQPFDVELTTPLPVSAISDGLNQTLPEGITITDAALAPGKRNPLDGQSRHYRVLFPAYPDISYPAIDTRRESVRAYLARDEQVVTIEKKQGTVSLDIRKATADCTLHGDGSLAVTLAPPPPEGRTPSIATVVAHMLGLGPEQTQGLHIIKTN